MADKSFISWQDCQRNLVWGGIFPNHCTLDLTRTPLDGVCVVGVVSQWTPPYKVGGFDYWLVPDDLSDLSDPTKGNVWFCCVLTPGSQGWGTIPDWSTAVSVPVLCVTDGQVFNLVELQASGRLLAPLRDRHQILPRVREAVNNAIQFAVDNDLIR